MPHSRATCAISGSSVEITTRERRRAASAASAVYASSGLPISEAIFFRGIPLDPPRAVMIPSTRIFNLRSRFTVVVDIVQPLLPVWRDAHQRVRDAGGYIAIAVELACGITPVPQLFANRHRDIHRVRRDSRHVHVRLAAFLAISHQHDRRSEIAGVPHEAAG